MGLDNLFVAILGAALLAWSGASIADEYRADEYRPNEFLGLDLSKAVLSPKRLGPESEFAPIAVEAKTEGIREAVQARVEPKGPANIAVLKPGVRKANVAQLRAEKPRGVARTKLARRHGNPLDAQAQDTRIQAWPCKSGGICSWK
jgi:hypothetical protein